MLYDPPHPLLTPLPTSPQQSVTSTPLHSERFSADQFFSLPSTCNRRCSKTPPLVCKLLTPFIAPSLPLTVLSRTYFGFSTWSCQFNFGGALVILVRMVARVGGCLCGFSFSFWSVVGGFGYVCVCKLQELTKVGPNAVWTDSTEFSRHSKIRVCFLCFWETLHCGQIERIHFLIWLGSSFSSRPRSVTRILRSNASSIVFWGSAVDWAERNCSHGFFEESHECLGGHQSVLQARGEALELGFQSGAQPAHPFSWNKGPVSCLDVANQKECYGPIPIN